MPAHCPEKEQEASAPGGREEMGQPSENGTASKDGSGAGGRTPSVSSTGEAASAGGAGGDAAGEFKFGDEGATDMDRTILRTLEMLSKVIKFCYQDHHRIFFFFVVVVIRE